MENLSEMRHEKYMRRCLQLAQGGALSARPNPMVGAVIVHRDRIIGEGFHQRSGQPHAEVNAFNSVKPDDEALLGESTIYVSLEPCSHYGKTPPCADLIVHKGVPEVVVGSIDPCSKVCGKGIERLREAGVNVIVGILEKECLALNRHFFTFQRLHRPFITLKWAQSANGFLDDQFVAYPFSTPHTQILVHKLRAAHAAILVGNTTERREHPRLTVRHWAGENPQKFVLSHNCPIEEILEQCRQQNLISLLVEGGKTTLQSFMDLNLWDEIRVEISPKTVNGGTPAPEIPENAVEIRRETCDGNVIKRFSPDKLPICG